MALGFCKARRDDLTAASFGASDAKMELLDTDNKTYCVLVTPVTEGEGGRMTSWETKTRNSQARRNKRLQGD